MPLWPHAGYAMNTVHRYDFCILFNRNPYSYLKYVQYTVRIQYTVSIHVQLLYTALAESDGHPRKY